MSKKILITGGTGFIGNELYKTLKSNGDYDVTSFSRLSLDLYDDALVESVVQKIRPDVVIHCATYDAAPGFSKKDKKLVLEKNLRMYLNLARTSAYFQKMLYFGSGSEFGRDSWAPQMKERDIGECIPQDQYGLSKYMMNMDAQRSRNIYNLRLFTVFGEEEDWRYRTVSNLCCKKVKGKKLVIPEDRKRDFLYIKDLMGIVELFLSIEPEFHDYNICSGEVLKNSDVARKLDVNFVHRGRRLSEYSGDNRRLLAEFPFLKFTPFDEALQNVVDYHRENENSICEHDLEY